MARRKRGFLYFDVLGTKALWLKRGQSAGEKRIGLFPQVVEQGMHTATRRFECKLLDGSIWTDSAGLLFESVADAILGGLAIYQKAYDHATDGRDTRLYFRGTITTARDDALESTTLDEPSVPNLTKIMFSHDQVKATIFENSGFRGMRIVTTRSDVDEATADVASCRYRKATRLAGLVPVVGHLHGNLYPRHADRLLDVLWPLGPTDEFKRRSQRLEQRFIDSKGDSEEKRQLRPTNALFGFVKRVVDSNLSQ